MNSLLFDFCLFDHYYNVSYTGLWYLVGIISIAYIEPILQPYAETVRKIITK